MFMKDAHSIACVSSDYCLSHGPIIHLSIQNENGVTYAENSTDCGNFQKN